MRSASVARSVATIWRVHGRGAVAELGGADGGEVPAVGRERDRGLGDVPERAPSSRSSRPPCPRRPASCRRSVRRRRCRGPGLPRRGRGTGRARSRPDQVGLGSVVRRQQRVALADRVDAAQLERVDAEAAGRARPSPIRRRGSPGRGRSRGTPRTARCSCRRPRRRPAWPGSVVEADRLGAAVEQHAARVVAVGAGVAQHVDLHRGEHAVGVGAEGDLHPHRVPHGGALELVGAAHLVRDRPAGAQHGERDEVFGVASPACRRSRRRPAR